jgi:gas vesicle protein
MTKGQGFAVGFLAFAAGIALGMLIAPKTGKELRNDLQKAAQKVTDLYEDLNFADLTENEIVGELQRRG